MYRLRRLAVCCLLAGALAGCEQLIEGLATEAENIRTEAVGVLQQAVDDLRRESSAWREVVDETLDRLDSTLHDTVREDLTELAERAVARAGIEFRCNADFVGDRVREGIERLIAELSGVAVPPTRPRVCHAIPNAVPLNRVAEDLTHLEFAGYNFDSALPVEAFVVNEAGEENVSWALHRVTHYLMTLDLGLNGAELDAQSLRIELRWDGEVLSDVAVIQPRPPRCEERVAIGIVPPQTYTPPHTRGDDEFDGHGPRIWASVRLQFDTDRVMAQLYMKAEETRSDWTTAEGRTTRTIYRAPAGWEIIGINGPGFDEMQYLDDDHAIDEFWGSVNGLVDRWLFVGDTRGDEAGTETQMEVFIADLEVILRETGDCEP